MRVTKTFTLSVPVVEELKDEDNMSEAVDEALRERYDL